MTGVLTMSRKTPIPTKATACPKNVIEAEFANREPLLPE
jgi:hypothetical protein